ncbi:MAG: diacylglycerol kinase family protein [Sediminicola sp.]|tara:strand:- start:27785 stop:28663 length:879 start_codon:yes stop_codon:yes gene_type:complete
MARNPQKILIVVNPISGDLDKSEILERIKLALAKEDTIQIFNTTGEEDLKNLGSVANNFGPDRILAVGGDGTIQLISEALQGEKPIIGIIPAGSANGLATDLDLPPEIEEAIPIALGSRTTWVDTLLINDTFGLHISDLGINAELIQNYSESTIRGYFGYALNVIPTLVNTDTPYELTLEANGETRTVQAVMLAFANSKKFGTGAMVNPDGKIDDGKFEVLIFKKLDIMEILKTLMSNTDMDPEFVEIVQTTKALVTSKIPISLQIDGEPFGKVNKVSVSILPKNIQVAIGI